MNKKKTTTRIKVPETPSGSDLVDMFSDNLVKKLDETLNEEQKTILVNFWQRMVEIEQHKSDEWMRFIKWMNKTDMTDENAQKIKTNTRSTLKKIADDVKL